MPMPLPVYLVMARGDPHTLLGHPSPAYIGYPSIPAVNQLHSQAGSQRHLWLSTLGEETAGYRGKASQEVNSQKYDHTDFQGHKRTPGSLSWPELGALWQETK